MIIRRIYVEKQLIDIRDLPELRRTDPKKDGEKFRNITTLKKEEFAEIFPVSISLEEYLMLPDEMLRLLESEGLYSTRIVFISDKEDAFVFDGTFYLYKVQDPSRRSRILGDIEICLESDVTVVPFKKRDELDKYL